LIDARHEPTRLDLQLHEWLIFNNKNHIVVATKADKLSTNNLNKSLKQIKANLKGSKIIAYSAINGLGKDAVWHEINTALEKT
jgi:GTP-binding protein